MINLLFFNRWKSDLKSAFISHKRNIKTANKLPPNTVSGKKKATSINK
jgi:hypothetical protein